MDGMTREGDVSNDRGVSDLVGVAILISLSIGGSLAIVAIGGIALNSLTDQAQQDLADDSLRNVDARLSALADRPVDSTTEFTFPEGTGDRIEANASAGQVYINATTKKSYEDQTVEWADTGDSSCTVQQEMGTITHERDNGNKMVYQGGGLWEQTPAGTMVESAPNFDYDNTSISFGFINITGLQSVSEGEQLTARKLAGESETATADVTNELEDCWQLDGASGTVPVSINVTIQSEYYEGWGRYAKTDMQTPPGAVAWNNASNTVTLHFGDVGGATGVFSNASADFPGPVIYSGQSQHAQYNNKLNPDGTGPAAFTADMSAISGSKVSVAYYDDDAGAWAYNKDSESTVGNWQYNGKPGGPDPSDNPLIDDPGGTIYDFDTDVPICVIKGSGFPGQLNSGNCKTNMVGTNSSAVSGVNQSVYDVAIDNTNSSIKEGEVLGVDVTVTNNGTEDGDKYVALFDDDKNLVDYQRLAIDNGTDETTTLTWQTGTGDSPSDDTRTVIVATADDNVTQDVTVTDATVNSADFEVDSVGSNTPVEVGETLTVTASIENTGSATGTQYVTLEDRNGNLTDVETVSSLAVGNTDTVTLKHTPTTQTTSGPVDLTVETENDDETTSVTVDPASGMDGVRYIGPADDGSASKYFVQQGYSGTGGNSTAGNSGNLKDTGQIDYGYVIEPRDSLTYDVYLGDTETGQWVEVVQGTDSHRYVDGSNVAGGDSSKLYDTLAADSNAVVCIANAGADVNGTDPATSDCGAIYNKTGGLDYDDGENVLEVEGTQGNLSVLTTQIGERVEEREDVRRPIDVWFVLDESGSMLYGDYEGYDYRSGTNTVPEGEVWYDDGTWYEPGTTVDFGYYAEGFYIYDEGSDIDGERIDATKAFLGSLNDSLDQAGASQFDGYATTMTQSPELKSSLDNVNGSLYTDPGGTTNMERGIDDGIEGLQTASDPDKRVMVLLGDGKNQQGDPLEAARDADDANITIYTVGLGDDVDENELTQIADETGGKYFKADNADALEEKFEQIAKRATNEALIQRSRTEVAAVNDAGKEWSVSLDGDSNLNDPTQYNTSSSTALQEQLSSGLNNSDLSFEVTVYGCTNYSAIDGVTSTVDGDTYTHATCTDYDTSDSTTIDNDDIQDHVIITANNSNSLSDISATGDWQPDPEDVASVDKDDLGDGEALIGLEVAHENQTGYVLMQFEVPTNETVRDNWDGDLSDDTDETDFDVTLTNAPDEVTRGNQATVDVTVTNYGDEGTEAIVLKNDAGIVVDSKTQNLNAGNSASPSLTWDTTGAPDGDNNLTVAVESDSDSAMVEVLANVPEFEVTGVSGETVTEGERMEVTGTITNDGQKSDEAQVVLEVEEGGDWHTVDATDTTTLTTSGSSQSTAVTLTWNTTVGDAGTHDVRLTTADDTVTGTGTVQPASDSGSNIGTTVGDPSSEPINIDVSQIQIE
jgi:hypothetical protein